MLNDYAKIDKVQKLDFRFTKYAKNDYVFELKSRIEILTEEIEKLVSKKDLEKTVENISKEIYSKTKNLVSKKNVSELFKTTSKGKIPIQTL